MAGRLVLSWINNFTIVEANKRVLKAFWDSLFLS